MSQQQSRNVRFQENQKAPVKQKRATSRAKPSTLSDFLNDPKQKQFLSELKEILGVDSTEQVIQLCQNKFLSQSSKGTLQLKQKDFINQFKGLNYQPAQGQIDDFSKYLKSHAQDTKFIVSDVQSQQTSQRGSDKQSSKSSKYFSGSVQKESPKQKTNELEEEKIEVKSFKSKQKGSSNPFQSDIQSQNSQKSGRTQLSFGSQQSQFRISKAENSLLSKQYMNMKKQQIVTQTNQGFLSSRPEVLNQKFPVFSGTQNLENFGYKPLPPTVYKQQTFSEKSHQISRRLQTAAREMGLDQKSIDHLSELPKRLNQISENSSQQIKKLEKREQELREIRTIQKSRYGEVDSTNNFHRTEEGVQIQKTQEEKRKSLLDFVNENGYVELIKQLAQSQGLTAQQQRLAEESLTREGFIENLELELASLYRQKQQIENKSAFDPDKWNELDENEKEFEKKKLQLDELKEKNKANYRYISDDIFGKNKELNKSDVDQLDEVLSKLANDRGYLNDFEFEENQSDFMQNPSESSYSRQSSVKSQISSKDLSSYILQAMHFISQISGPIQSILLKTYKKQTHIFKGHLEKKETNSFKVAPGAAFRLRQC